MELDFVLMIFKIKKIVSVSTITFILASCVSDDPEKVARKERANVAFDLGAEEQKSLLFTYCLSTYSDHEAAESLLLADGFKKVNNVEEVKKYKKEHLSVTIARLVPSKVYDRCTVVRPLAKANFVIEKIKIELDSRELEYQFKGNAANEQYGFSIPALRKRLFVENNRIQVFNINS